MKFISLDTLEDLKNSASEELKKKDDYYDFWSTIHKLVSTSIKEDLDSVYLTPKQIVMLLDRLKVEQEVVYTKLIKVRTDKIPYLLQYKVLTNGEKKKLQTLMSKQQKKYIVLALKSLPSHKKTEKLTKNRR